MQPQRLPLISCASRWAKAAPAGSRSRSQFPLSVSSAKACSPLRACITRWRVTDFSLPAWGNCSENRRRRSLQLFFRGSPQSCIACSGTYGEILNFEVTVDFIFFGMTAAALFILRRRRIGSDSVTYRVPGHPFTTMLFVLSCAAIVLSAIIASPRNSAIALCIMLAGLPVYYFWSRFRRPTASSKQRRHDNCVNFNKLRSKALAFVASPLNSRGED